MGETEVKKPQLGASKIPVSHCPLCGAGPLQGDECFCNIEIQCPEEGGCGRTFKVFSK